VRLGIYADLLYRSDGQTISTDHAFVEFVLNLPPRVNELVIFGRLSPDRDRAPYAMSRPSVRFVPLPYYPSARDLVGLTGALRRSARIFAREVDNLDAVWIFGPHPLALGFAAIASRHEKAVFFGVRQDFPRYIASRLPNKRWLGAIPVASALEQVFRLAARRVPSIVVGDQLARRYAGGKPVLASVFSLVRRGQVVSASEIERRPWASEIRVLSVGRLEPEKNPLLLVEALAGLRERDRRWRLTIVGDGAFEERIATLARDLRVRGSLELVGYVPNGKALCDLYRTSDVFLHTALTEGLPQVLLEALAAGLPVVATDVGGVGAALGYGERGLLIPPRNVRAAIAALELLAEDPELRTRLAKAGVAYASRHTLEAELDRIAEFMYAQMDERSASPCT
jgi:glycosyltransferase involved in cell wall biosynthesis